jgi:hypothetical protein
MILHFKTLWQRRWFRISIWMIATVVTLLVLVTQWVNWRGARAWRSAQERFVRDGETLEVRKTMPRPIPDRQNFCAVAALDDLALVIDHDEQKGEPAEKRRRLAALKLPTDAKPAITDSIPTLASEGALGVRTDLTAWAQWLRKEGSLAMPPESGNAARDILAALSKHDALIAELALAAHRPESQWTPAWSTRELPEMIFSIQLPHYHLVLKVTRTFALRAIAAARAGDPAKAQESLLVAVRLAEASLQEPFLMGALVGMTQLHMVHNALWEVCEVHAGTAEDFQRLQDFLARVDLQAALLRVFRTELAGGAEGAMWMKRTRDMQLLEAVAGHESDGHAPWIERALLGGLPAGWFDSNAATVINLGLKHILHPLRDGGLAGLYAEKSLESELMRRKGENQQDSVLACLFFPAVAQVGGRAAYVQSQTSQAIAACALERWFIAHGSYPDTLAAVSSGDGKPLPTDVLSGKPMGYRKTSDGRYALWCVGPDHEDDGGKRVLDEKQPEKTKFAEPSYTGDWVWDFPRQ